MLCQTTLEPLKQALDEFVAYPQKLQDLSAHAQGVTVGRWVITVNCRHGSYLLDEPQEVSFAMDLDFPKVRQAIYRIRDDIEDEFEESWAGIDGVQQWIETGLPRLVEDLGRALPATDREPAALKQALAKLETDLSSGTEVLETGLTALRGLFQRQPRHETSVQEMNVPIAAEVQERLEELTEKLAEQPCGHDDARQQFSHFQTELTESTRALMAATSQLVRNTGVVAHAVESLWMAVGELHADVERLIALVEDADAAAVPGIVAAMKLGETAEAWNSLNAHAQALLAPNPLRSPLRPALLRKRADAYRD